MYKCINYGSEMSMKLNIDQNNAKEAEQIYKELGLTLASAIDVFIKKSIDSSGFPFDMTTSNRSRNGSGTIPTNTTIVRTIHELAESVLTAEEVNKLTEKEFCSDMFSINFPVLIRLKRDDKDYVRQAVKDTNGYNRYSVKSIVRRENEMYAICTQWTDKHRTPFCDWARKYNIEEIG